MQRNKQTGEATAPGDGVGYNAPLNNDTDNGNNNTCGGKNMPTQLA